jgi:predicted neuraminidase
MKYLILLFCFLFSTAKSGLILREEFVSQGVEHFDCHSSNIIETSKGKYCVVYKGGSGEGRSNIDMKQNVGIWLTRFDGNSWSKPREIVTSSESICWSPVLCKNQEGELLLFYRIGPDPRHAVSFVKQSLDGGTCWSEAKMLPAGIVGPTKAKPLLNAQGDLISPSSVEVGAPEDLYKSTACWIEISKDQGHTWEKIGPLEIPDRRFGVIEPTLFFDEKGNLHLLCRDRAHRIGREGFIWTAVSKDGGYHWSKLMKTHLPNPDSGLDTINLGEGKILLAYNHSHTERFPLNLALSLDGGDSWSEPFVLSDRGEFPSMILGSDQMIHITFAAPMGHQGQRGIKHIVIDPKEMENQLNFKS